MESKLWNKITQILVLSDHGYLEIIVNVDSYFEIILSRTFYQKILSIRFYVKFTISAQ